MKVLSNVLRLDRGVNRVYEKDQDLELELLSYYVSQLNPANKELNDVLFYDIKDGKKFRAEAFYITYKIAEEHLSRDLDMPIHEIMSIKLLMHKDGVLDYMDLSHLKECVRDEKLSYFRIV